MLLVNIDEHVTSWFSETVQITVCLFSEECSKLMELGGVQVIYVATCVEWNTYFIILLHDLPVATQRGHQEKQVLVCTLLSSSSSFIHIP